MFAVRRINRPAIVCALASAALMSAAPAGAAQQQELRSPDSGEAGVAVVRAGSTGPDVRAGVRAALAQERYYSSHGNPGVSAALAQERHYSSYGNPAALTLPQSRVTSDGTPWVSIVLGLSGALVIAAVSAVLVRGLRIRRRRPVRVTI